MNLPTGFLYFLEKYGILVWKYGILVFSRSTFLWKIDKRGYGKKLFPDHWSHHWTIVAQLFFLKAPVDSVDNCVKSTLIGFFLFMYYQSSQEKHSECQNSITAVSKKV